MLNFGEFIKESVKTTLTLYHGTCYNNGAKLIDNGWKPLSGLVGGNMGNPNYLYLSSEPEDALWFAEERGCNTVVEISDIPIDYLRPDPEDEAGYTISELFIRMDKHNLPAKFILTKSLDSSHFSLYKF